MAAYRIEYITSVKKSFRNLSHDAQKQVRSAIEALAENPRPHGCLKLEAEDGLWRIRLEIIELCMKSMMLFVS
ncbi:MAG TPA: type II toxin-antitoxin system RelE/ParE family toxin [Candidatus Kapabacteria bacterium]